MTKGGFSGSALLTFWTPVLLASCSFTAVGLPVHGARMPAYQNLRQRVDNFVANHLATHTWSPHLNKNQLRNNIRQQVLKSGMLESGIDRIISQVVDPKINHTFRPQVEKAVHEFLATLNHKEEASASTVPDDEKPDSSILTQGVPAPGPSANVANDAMSILETITSLNQEANAARASTETSNVKANERVSKKFPPQPSTDTNAEKERTSEDTADRDRSPPDSVGEALEAAPKSEEAGDLPGPAEEIKNHTKESNSLILVSKEVQQENSDQKNKPTDKEKKPDSNEKGERKKEKKEKTEKKFDHSKRSEEIQKLKDERQAKEKDAESSKLPVEKNSNKTKMAEGTKEDCSLVDSDVDGLTDITVSSVHTSDLSSFEEDTEEEVVMSDSTEEGEITSDDEEKSKQNKTKIQTSDPSEGKVKNVRHAYVHKPYLYSKYYSDSDDELTVEQRRQSIAKEKEERLLRRQINREKLEEKRKQKAEKTKSSKAKSQGKGSVDLEESSTKSLEPKAPRIKEVLKERKVLEKKVALSKKRKKDSRSIEENSKKKQPPEEDSKETLKTSEHCEKEKVSSSKEPKHVHAKSESSKPARRLSECVHPADENRSECRAEREHKRRTSTPAAVEGAQEEADVRDGKRQAERSETGTEELPRQKSTLKSERHLKKDDSEAPHSKSLPKKEVRSSKEKPEKEKTLSEDKLSMKHKYKGDSVHKTGDEADLHSSEKGLKADDNIQKQNQQAKLSSDDKADRKSKHRNERKLSILGKDGKPVSEYLIKTDENVRKENNKKERHLSAEKAKAEHRSRRSSGSKVQKEPLSSRQHGTSLQRRSESYSEDKCDVDSTHFDSHSKPEEAHKEKRRTKSLLEERLVLKSKSKSQGKQLKGIEIELQESVTKQATTPKPDKEKNTEESDSDKQRKSKTEDKPCEETGAEPVSESASSHTAQKDVSHRTKLSFAKEKYKGDKDSSSSRLERKLSDGHRSRSLKHSSRDGKKKEENKSDDKDGKEVDSNHEKAKGNSLVEKKLSRRLCENRRGSLSQEVTKGEEKLATNISGTSSVPSLQRPKKSGDTTTIPEQEPMEIDSEPATENVSVASKAQDSSNHSSQQDLDSGNVMKQKPTSALLKEPLRTSMVDSRTAAPAYKSGRGMVVGSEKHAGHKATLTKKTHIQSTVSKPNPEEKEAVQQGAHEIIIDSETSHRMSPAAPSENDSIQKNLKNTSKPSEEHVAQGDAALEHSINLGPSPPLSSATVVPQKGSHDSDTIPSAVKRTVLEGGTASTSLADQSPVPHPSLTLGDSDVPRTGDSKEGSEGSTVNTPANAGIDSIRHIPEGSQTPLLHSKQGKVSKPHSSKLTDMAVGNENVNKEVGLKDMAKKENDLISEPGLKQNMRATVDNGKKDGIAIDHVAGINTEEDAESIELTERVSINRGPGEMENLSIDGETRNENSEVDTSAGGEDASFVVQQRDKTAKNVTAGSGKAEKTFIATSTEGKDKAVTLNSVKMGAATITSSETGESEIALPCTSIEADEGLITGACSRNNPLHVGADPSESTVFAAAEEGGGVVTEGFAESETFLTSTKEGESGECTMAESEERATGPVTAHTGKIEDNVNSVGTEEKDDAVTSAGSEEKCDGSSSRDSEIVEGTVTFISEVESDGAVTSAGTEIREGSLSSEEVDEFQKIRTRLGPKKETEGTVTCTVAEGRSDNFVICSVTGAGPQEERMVTGANVVLVDIDRPPGTSASQEGDGSVNDGTEGESAVTSTGITEEDGEGPASCTGSEDSSEGFAVSSESEENGENAMDSTVAKEVTNAPLATTAGPCDDEGIVTSTGAKEEEDEGEGVVTSTGRGNEIGHSSACTEIEENEGALICESAEGDSAIGTAVEHVEAEAGAAIVNANESNVDSRSGTEKEIKDTEICSSAKGIVESSVTSAVSGKGEVASVPEGCQSPMTSVASDQSDRQLARKEKVEDATISTGIVGGSYEVLVSGAVPECEVDHTTGEKEDEGIITSVENQECDGLMAATVSDGITNQNSLAGGKSQEKGLMISTSTTSDYTPQLSMIVNVEKGHSSALRSGDNVEDARVNMEEFEAPMPSAAAGGDSQPTATRNEEKDECAMISTSIQEEFEVPISSATTTKSAESQQLVAAVEERDKDPISESTEDFEAPMPSAPTEVESPLASTSKDEKDECALISTSIAEECEASISGVAVESENVQSATVLEEKDGSAVISTSSVEDCEGPVSSAAPQEEIHPCVTPAEEISDTTMISTSTSEGREAIMVSAIPRDEDQPTTARVEDPSDAAIISTSTAECALIIAGLDQCKENQLPASIPKGNDDLPALSAAKVSKRAVPAPSLIAENNRQCPRPLAGGKEVGPVMAGSIEKEREHTSISVHSAGSSQPSTANAGEKDGRGKDCSGKVLFAERGQCENALSLVNTGGESILLSSVQKGNKSHEARTARGSTTASWSARRDLERSAHSLLSLQGPEEASGQTAEDSSVSVRCLAAVDTGAKEAGLLGGQDAAAGHCSAPTDQRRPEDHLKTTSTECINGQESEVTPSNVTVLPAASDIAQSAPNCEQDLTVKSGPGHKWTAEASTGKAGDGHGVTQSLQGEGDLFPVTVSPEGNVCATGNEESPLQVLGGLELKASLKTETLVPSEEEKTELLVPPGSPCVEKPSGIGNLQRVPSLVSESLDVKNSDSGTKEELHSKSWDKEEISNGKNTSTETARGCRVEANPKEVEISVQEEERHMAKRKRKKHCPSSDDELDDNPDALISRVGTSRRPRSQTELHGAKEACSGDLRELATASCKTSSTASKTKDEKDESSSSEATGEKTEPNDDDTLKSREDNQPVIIKRRRGRPRKHPIEAVLKAKEDSRGDTGLVTVEQPPANSKVKVMQTESSEPERKRQKWVSDGTEDKKDQESDEEEEEEEDDEPSGATTRSATRSEAQRSKTQISPCTKRKREASPPGARTRGQQRVEEAPVKKAKR
ncbi:biorientation of chromosomes in cell division protein 1-like 1 [Orycteropus afer afer]|uniref:Biorientation of chromosomes in cell division protein 1-like 1 n=1 Tax=Orycteropus afer afer TaxID=1230840 RepID=A0A8B7B2R9_ORYAF|nr:biorientation of chromosomes in cell division protein 1-like 1 [Orycteropus afer afer]